MYYGSQPLGLEVRPGDVVCHGNGFPSPVEDAQTMIEQDNDGSLEIESLQLNS